MDIAQIGFDMMLVPVIIVGFFVLGMIVYVMFLETVKAWRDRNVMKFSSLLLAWSFIIGSALALVGSV